MEDGEKSKSEREGANTKRVPSWAVLLCDYEVKVFPFCVFFFSISLCSNAARIYGTASTVKTVEIPFESQHFMLDKSFLHALSQCHCAYIILFKLWHCEISSLVYLVFV